jgi:hypothetical protein
MTEKKTSPLVYVAGGCGLLSVFGCCVFGVVGVFYWQEQQNEYAAFDDPYAIGGGGGSVDAPGPAPMPLVIVPAPMPSARMRTIVATVERVGGTIPVSAGDTCSFSVEVQQTDSTAMGYWCHTIATCNGTALYGGPSNGFFPCAVYDSPPGVVGEDSETSGSGDTDGSFQLDTRAGTLIMRDDAAGAMGAFRVEARVMSVL